MDARQRWESRFCRLQEEQERPTAKRSHSEVSCCLQESAHQESFLSLLLSDGTQAFILSDLSVDILIGERYTIPPAPFELWWSDLCSPLYIAKLRG